MTQLWMESQDEPKQLFQTCLHLAGGFEMSRTLSVTGKMINGEFCPDDCF